MKRRLLSFIVSFVLVMSLAACGGNKGTVGSSSNNSVTETDAQSDDEDDIADNTDSDIEKDAGVQPVSVIIGSHSEKVWDGEAFGKVMAEYNFFDMSLSEEDREKYPELASRLEKNAKTEEEGALETVGFLTDEYESYFEGVDAAERLESTTYLEQSSEATVMRADSNIVSASIFYYDYQGGVHGMYGLFGENYDTKTGELLSFSDVVTDEDKFFEIVDDKLKTSEEYGDIYEELMPLDEYRKGLSEEGPVFIVDNEGVIIIFNPYSLGPYSFGMQVIKVFFFEAPEIFNDKYTEVCDSYVIPMLRELNYTNTIDVSGDGKRFPVIIDYEYDAGYSEEFESFTVSLGNRSVKIDDFGYIESMESYIVKTGEKYYFLGFYGGMGDWTTSAIVDLSTMREVEKEYRVGEYATGYLAYESIEYSFDESDPEKNRHSSRERRYAFTNPDRIMFSPDFDTLGNTRSGITTFAMDSSSGELRMIGEYIEITGEYFALKTLKEVSCDFVSLQGDVEKSGSIPAGTFLCMIKTDGNSWADFQVVDEDRIDLDQEWEHYPLKDEGPYKYDSKKEIIRIYLESTGGYYNNIDGINEDDVFGGILYAG